MKDTSIPKPTSSHILWGGAVEIHCFGKPQNWSLAGASALAADMRNPGIRYRMHQMAERYGCERIYAPNPSKFNARIANTDAFDVEWADERVLRGPFADGVLLTEPNTAFAVSSADCPTAVLHDSQNGNVAVAHSGLKSLYDSFMNPVTIEMFQAIRISAGSNFSSRALQGFIACGIGPSAYYFDPEHPKFSEEKMRVCERLISYWRESILDFDNGWLVDLPTLIRLQFESCGVAQQDVGFDSVCTRDDLGPDSKPLWHSNRRGDKTRNLVLVIRR